MFEPFRKASYHLVEGAIVIYRVGQKLLYRSKNGISSPPFNETGCPFFLEEQYWLHKKSCYGPVRFPFVLKMQPYLEMLLASLPVQFCIRSWIQLEDQTVIIHTFFDEYRWWKQNINLSQIVFTWMTLQQKRIQTESIIDLLNRGRSWSKRDLILSGPHHCSPSIRFKGIYISNRRTWSFWLN